MNEDGSRKDIEAEKEAENLKRLIDCFVEKGISPQIGLFLLFLETFITRAIARHPKGVKIARTIMEMSEIPATEEELKVYLNRIRKIKESVNEETKRLKENVRMRENGE